MSEDLYPTIRLIVYIVGVPIIAALLFSIVHKTRAISKRIAEVRELEKQTAQNPYAQMAALYEQNEARQTIERAKRGKI